MNATITLSPANLFAPIAADLKEAEKVLQAALTNSQPGIAELLQHLQHYRGKRLRPALLLLTARACGEVTRAHYVLAAVVEMIHTATLVHDDVLDGATLRRHVATVNAGWGVQASLLLGDYLFTHAFHLASTLDDPRACRIIGESTNRLCEGELHQVCRRGQLDMTEEEYLAIIDGKTAELTACCCRLGAQYAGMGDDIVERLTRYGRNLGMAFQIADDLLDLVGEEQTTGKSLGTDLEQQKMTLPVIRLLRKSQREVAERVRRILESPGNHKRAQLHPELIASESCSYAQSRAEAFATAAAQELGCLPESPYRNLLEMLTERVVNRNA